MIKKFQKYATFQCLRFINSICMESSDWSQYTYTGFIYMFICLIFILHTQSTLEIYYIYMYMKYIIYI